MDICTRQESKQKPYTIFLQSFPETWLNKNWKLYHRQAQKKREWHMCWNKLRLRQCCNQGLVSDTKAIVHMFVKRTKEWRNVKVKSTACMRWCGSGRRWLSEVECMWWMKCFWVMTHSTWRNKHKQKNTHLHVCTFAEQPWNGTHLASMVSFFRVFLACILWWVVGCITPYH